MMSGSFHIFGSDDWVVLKQGEVLTQEVADDSAKKAVVVYFRIGYNEGALELTPHCYLNE